jgi:Protein of unknown function (DUF4240)
MWNSRFSSGISSKSEASTKPSHYRLKKRESVLPQSNNASFWSLIEVLDGSSSESAVSRLEQQLAARSPEQIEAFDRSLQETLASLEEQPQARAIADAVGATSPDDDACLFLRCAIVATGHERFRAVCEDPTLLKVEWDLSGADLLWDVASQPYEAVTGDSLVRTTDVVGDRASDLPWVSFVLGDSKLRFPRLWDAFFWHFRDRITKDPAWLAWRDDNSVTKVWFYLSYRDGVAKSGRQKLSVGVRAGVVEAHVTRDKQNLPRVPTLKSMHRETEWLMRQVTAKVST